MKYTKIISGFPGVGKSYLFNEVKDKIVLDSDSSQFSWIEEGVRNPEFPNNYIQHIKDNIGKVDIILISSHKIVRDALRENNIHYTIIYPSIKYRIEYLERYKLRGNDEDFINMIGRNWNQFIVEIEKETFPTKIRLYFNTYLKDLVDKACCKYYEERCSVNETNADEYEFNPCSHCRDGKGMDYRFKLL